MYSISERAALRAIIATRDDIVREFVASMLEQRGFSVELAHRPEYLEVVGPSATLLVADAETLRTYLAMGAKLPNEVVVLIPRGDAEHEDGVCAPEVVATFAVPFTDPRALAGTFDAVAARAAERAQAARREPELAGVG